MKKADLPKNTQATLNRHDAAIEHNLTQLIAELVDLKARLYGGFSESWGFEITDPIMRNPDVCAYGTSSEVAKLVPRLSGLSTSLAVYEAVLIAGGVEGRDNVQHS